jgi:shikimate kinase
LAIVGYMGSGKTTLGRLLARATGLEFVDLDRAIVKNAGREIPQIFAEHGEARFRDLEQEALREALDGKTPCVVACGGGVVVRPENRAMLRSVTTIFLREDTGVLYSRTRGSGRPLRAASREEFESRYTERLPFYREVADLEVEVDGRPPALVAEEVLGCL